MRVYQKIIAITALLGMALTAQAADVALSTPAVSGYDVVSYQTEKRPVRGNGHYVATHDGATYIFSSQENLDLFNSNPARYVPAYGGYCAFGVSVGKKFIGDPEVWRVVNNRLYLNLDANIQDDWLKDVPGKIEVANAKWKQIANKAPSEL